MIIARKEELSILKEAYECDSSQFIAIYGRRRIGKTYLAREAFNYNFFFSHSGIANGSKKEEINAFLQSLKEQGGEYDMQASDWLGAFSYLKRKIESSDLKKKVIFLDELSWIAGKRGDEFLKALEFFWNSWASNRKDVLLLVSSSATSWLLNHIIHSKGGFYHRLNHTIKLSPFSLKECKEYVLNSDYGMTDGQILECYMVFGGIPYYWSLLKKGYGVSQNIDRLFFSETGELREEFTYLYSSMFNRPEEYIRIITAIAKKRKGLTRNELIEDAKIKDSGNLSKKIEELIACGFLKEYVPFGKKKVNIVYQLIDNFTIFYFHFMKPMPTDTNFYLNNSQSGKLNAWRGLSFELVCLQHIDQIKKALGIYGVTTQECSWTCKPNEAEGIVGHQIDFLISRKDSVINLCEMKYSQVPYAVTQKEEEDFRRRTSDFLRVTKTKSSVFTTLISPYGIQTNRYSNAISNVIDLSDLMN